MAENTAFFPLLVLSIAFLSVAYVVVSRLFFHPLAHVPGPKLAALFAWHEFYYDCIKDGGGQHAFEIQRMHQKYGPIVRIGPNEVHIDGRTDPHFWDILYTNSTKFDKDAWYYNGFGHLSTVATAPAELHRARRGAMANYFSMTNVRKYEPMVLARISQLCNRLEKRKVEQEPVELAHAWRCLATDVVTSFAIPEPRKMLELPDFGKDFNRLICDFARLITYQRHLYLVFPILTSVPDWLTIKMDSTSASVQMVEYQRSFERNTQVAIDRKGQPPKGESPSILDAIVTSSELKERDKLADRVVEEARNTVGAGTETTASTLTMLTWHLLNNPSKMQRLLTELRAAAPNDPRSDEGESALMSFKTLDKLPYLAASINEALRLCCPVSGRLPRVNPRAATTYTAPATNSPSYTLPAGTVMSMSMPDLHSNASIFPSPHSFQPERWLDASVETKAEMNQFFVPFGKGSRQCIGMELAKMELVLAAGNVLRRFGERMELFETTERDVSWAYDFFAPFAPHDSPGLRVVVR